MNARDVMVPTKYSTRLRHAVSGLPIAVNAVLNENEGIVVANLVQVSTDASSPSATAN